MAINLGPDQDASEEKEGEIYERLKTFQGCVQEAGVAIGSLRNLSEDDELDTLFQYQKIISSSVDWGVALSSKKLGRAVKIIFSSLDDLADVFGNEKAFAVLKNYKHPSDEQAYAAILIDESRKLAETVNRELKALKPGMLSSKSFVNNLLPSKPEKITVDLLIEKTQKVMDVIDKQERLLAEKQALAEAPEPVVARAEEVVSMRLESQYERVEAKIEAFECQIEDKHFDTLAAINTALEEQAHAMTKIIGSFNRLGDDSKHEMEAEVGAIQQQHEGILATLHGAKRELMGLHEEKEQLEKALSIKEVVSNSASNILSHMSEMEQDVKGMTASQKKSNKKEKSDLFSQAHEAFVTHIQSMNQAIKAFFKGMSEGEADMPDQIKAALKEDLAEQAQGVTEPLKQAGNHEVTEKEALALISPESAEAFHQALNPKGPKLESKKFDRATHAVMKRVSSSYASQCKAYKNKLSDLKAISGSTEEEISASEQSKASDNESQRPKKGF